MGNFKVKREGVFGTFSIVYNVISESLSYFLMVIKENE